MLDVWLKEQLLKRNHMSRHLFAKESTRLATLSQEMSERFLRGGRLLAFGKGAYATDAQHVSVEFVHPVIVGKRALPALDISHAFMPWLKTSLTKGDMVMGFAPSEGDNDINEALEFAKSKGALTVALPGTDATYALRLKDHHPFIQQELIEILYHTLWEPVHIFFEHHELGHDVGASSFLYPFLGETKQDTSSILHDVANSIEQKAKDDESLREHMLETSLATTVSAINEIDKRVSKGGKIISLGNGGSATDANDFVFDCLVPPAKMKPIAAISLSMESANLSAIANDVGVDMIFLRQLIAQANTNDVVLAFSTSGNSANIVASLIEARKRGLFTIALLGYDGGDILRQNIADISLVIPSDYIPRIQEVQASIYHLIREGLELIRG